MNVATELSAKPHTVPARKFMGFRRAASQKVELERERAIPSAHKIYVAIELGTNSAPRLEI